MAGPTRHDSSAPLYVAAGIRSFVVAMTGVLLGLYVAETGGGPEVLGLVVSAGAVGSALATGGVAWRPGGSHRV